MWLSNASFVFLLILFSSHEYQKKKTRIDKKKQKRINKATAKCFLSCFSNRNTQSSVKGIDSVTAANKTREKCTHKKHMFTLKEAKLNKLATTGCSLARKKQSCAHRGKQKIEKKNENHSGNVQQRT